MQTRRLRCRVTRHHYGDACPHHPSRCIHLFRLLLVWVVTTAWITPLTAAPLADSPQKPSFEIEQPSLAPTVTLTPCFVQGVGGQVECIDLVDDHLSVVRIPSRSVLEHPPVVLFAGGPGQAASDMSRLPLVAQLRQEHDVLLIDQRGSGRNNPLDCELNSMESNSNQAQAEMKACFDSTKALSPQLSSLQLITDVETVRKALYYDTFALYGASYGTLTAQMYAATYPNRVQAMILDGAFAIDQNPFVMASPYAQASLEYLDTLCQSNPDCKATLGPWKNDLFTLMAELEAQPQSLTINGESVTLTRQILGHGIRASLYSPAMAMHLPYGITQAKRGDWRFMNSLFATMEGMTDSMYLGLSVGVLCKEQIVKGSAAKAKQLGQNSFAKDDFFTHWHMACPQEASKPTYLTPPDALNTPTLLISGALDPITPPESAELTLRYLTQAEHLVLPYDGHVNGSKPCMSRYIKRFLLGEAQTEDCVASSKPWPFNLGF